MIGRLPNGLFKRRLLFWLFFLSRFWCQDPTLADRWSIVPNYVFLSTMGAQQSSANHDGESSQLPVKTCYYDILGVDRKANDDELAFALRQTWTNFLTDSTASHQGKESISEKSPRASSRSKLWWHRECDETLRRGTGGLRSPFGSARASLVRLSPRCHPSRTRWWRRRAHRVPQHQFNYHRRHVIAYPPLRRHCTV